MSCKEKSCNNVNINNINNDNKAYGVITCSDVHVDSSLVHTPTPSFTVTDTTVHHKRHISHEESINNSNINDNNDNKKYSIRGSDNNNNNSNSGKSPNHSEHKKILVSEKVYSK